MSWTQQVGQLWRTQVNSGNIVYQILPTAVAPLVDATGVTATADAAGSKYGVVKTVAAAGLAVAFWICGIAVQVASAADYFVVAVTGAADVLVAEFGGIDITAVTVNVPPIFLPRPVRVAAGSKVGAKIANFDAVARTLNVQVIVATGIGT